jgi:tetratricopeptide (TPR) repeat protein/predicted Ser/Thr protein kinase
MSEDRAETTAIEPRPMRPELRPGTVVGRYVVFATLGHGGMGVVYRAFDPELERQVAVKLLRAERTDDDSRTRMLREAQALARLSHPNVVAVHDVGTYGGQVFVAMELVEGENLREWLHRGPHGQAQILARFLDAGRGLAAAHRAGLVHRDFKPSNVVLSDDGRVRVLDFGLARAVVAGEPDPEPAAAEGHGSGSGSSPLTTPVTQHGALLGTPSYMAPEQIEGGEVDHRCDQFGFCVALYEALYGERPFAGANLPELLGNVRGGRFAPVPAGARVPAWLRRILLRGLSTRPEDRYPTMDALLAELSSDPAARRRRRVTIAAAVLAGTGLVASGWYREHRRGGLCQGAGDRLAAVWGDAQRQAVAAGFAATGVSYADGARRGVEAAFDEFGGEWTAMRTAACEATHLRGEQSAELLDLRMNCLDQRLAEMRSLAELFADADADLVRQAADAARRLTPVLTCADVRGLRSRPEPPADPDRQAQVAAAGDQLAEARAATLAGRYDLALERARTALAEATAAGYAPPAAEAGYLVGDLLERLGEYDEARETYFQALAAAEAGHDDGLLARVAAAQTRLVGFRLREPEQGKLWAELARGALRRTGDDPAVAGAVLFGLGNAEFSQGHYDEAAELYRQSLTAREAALPPGHPEIIETLHGLGSTIVELGDRERAAAYHRRALKLQIELLGPCHPQVAETLNGLGNVLFESGQYDEAEARFAEAIDIWTESLGADHPHVGGAWTSLGIAAKARQEHGLATERFLRARKVFENALGGEHPAVAMTLVNLADVAINAGRPREALDAYQQALDIDVKSLGDDHPDLAFDLCGIGRAHLDLDQPANALAPLERALELRLKHSVTPAAVANTRYLLAWALWDAGRDRRRAVELAEAALEGYRGYGPKSAGEAAEVEQWLVEHQL